MSFTEFYGSNFSKSSQRKGEEYYNSGRVRIVENHDDSLIAEVQGTQAYDVEIELEGGSLNVECSCPAFDSEGYCKHLWATFLAMDFKGLLQKASAGKRSYTPLGASFTDPVFVDKTETLPKNQGQKLFEPVRWISLLTGITQKVETEPLTPRQHLVYIVDLPSSARLNHLVLQVLIRERKLNGELSRPKKLYLPPSAISRLSDPNDIQYLSILAGPDQSYPYYYQAEKSTLSTYNLTSSLAGFLLPMIAGAGRLYAARDDRCVDIEPLNWDGGEPFAFRLRVSPGSGKPGSYEVNGVISRDSEEYDLQTVDLIGPGYFVRGNVVSRFDTQSTFRLLCNLKSAQSISVPPSQTYRFIKEVMETVGPEVLDLASELKIDTLIAKPRPKLVFQNAGNVGLDAKVSFSYGDQPVVFKEADPKNSVFDVKTRRLLRRDLKAETLWKARFEEIGLKRLAQIYSETLWRVSRNRFPEVVRELLHEGCQVYAEGKHLRPAGKINISVSSGIDWFELYGGAEFEGHSVKFPDLLAAMKRGETVVQLTDGSYGLIPEEWLKKYGAVVALGEIKDDHLRYKMNQAFILDAMLAAQPEASFDAAFEKARDQLRSFDGVHPLEPPGGFVGNLRDYQKDALGWMKFLRDFGFGGCLADDMGLGKTVMVLALLQSRRPAGTQNPPSLVVVPRSLVFNWIQEASRFTPSLRILDHTGSVRKKKYSFKDCDVVLTTYGTLRSDAAWLKDEVFDYIILDEAQTVKNASTASAKAARLVQGNHRLALSGTPVQNHLGDLWSLFDFLNTGMLGASSVLNLAGSGAKKPDEQTVQLLAQALRPFILRRTKEQVAKELPARVEQTIFCDLTTDERRLYDELRDHYRQALLARVDSVGLSKSKIQVLEALLRLRQAACHPGLIDPGRGTEMSTKLEALIPQLVDVMEEGHKALVFSQFVSFLTILRHQLDQDGIQYQYLDGQTTDRQTPVETFQNDPECRLFLISLKAGGLGLNLTAADYVFLLDPWWNPVIEAQAIDRAHRIGQSRQVFAYRIIARDTVEEKVLQLQETKRNLADAIITADNSVLRNIQRTDLELLLS